jgi:hypothetical protein
VKAQGHMSEDRVTFPPPTSGLACTLASSSLLRVTRLRGRDSARGLARFHHNAANELRAELRAETHCGQTQNGPPSPQGDRVTWDTPGQVANATATTLCRPVQREEPTRTLARIKRRVTKAGREISLYCSATA